MEEGEGDFLGGEVGGPCAAAATPLLGRGEEILAAAIFTGRCRHDLCASACASQRKREEAAIWCTSLPHCQNFTAHKTLKCEMVCRKEERTPLLMA